MGVGTDKAIARRHPRISGAVMPAPSAIDNPVQSPCRRNCCLDDELNCLGCFRSLEEIKEWGVADEHRRRSILQNASARREARGA
jgi:uncharacterized protein